MFLNLARLKPNKHQLHTTYLFKKTTLPKAFTSSGHEGEFSLLRISNLYHKHHFLVQSSQQTISFYILVQSALSHLLD